MLRDLNDEDILNNLNTLCKETYLHRQILLPVERLWLVEIPWARNDKIHRYQNTILWSIEVHFRDHSHTPNVMIHLI